MRRDGDPAAVDEDHGVRIAVDGDVNLDAGPGAAQPREYEEQKLQRPLIRVSARSVMLE